MSGIATNPGPGHLQVPVPSSSTPLASAAADSSTPDHADDAGALSAGTRPDIEPGQVFPLEALPDDPTEVVLGFLEIHELPDLVQSRTMRATVANFAPHALYRDAVAHARAANGPNAAADAAAKLLEATQVLKNAAQASRASARWQAILQALPKEFGKSEISPGAGHPDHDILSAGPNHPDFFAARRGKAMLYQELGRHEEAINLLEDTIQLAPRAACLFVDLSAAYLNAGDAENAAHHARVALELAPGDPFAANRLARALLVIEDTVPSAELMNLLPHVQDFSTLSMIHERAGDINRSDMNGRQACSPSQVHSNTYMQRAELFASRAQQARRRLDAIREREANAAAQAALAAEADPAMQAGPAPDAEPEPRVNAEPQADPPVDPETEKIREQQTIKQCIEAAFASLHQGLLTTDDYHANDHVSDIAHSPFLAPLHTDPRWLQFLGLVHRRPQDLDDIEWQAELLAQPMFDSAETLAVLDAASSYKGQQLLDDLDSGWDVAINKFASALREAERAFELEHTKRAEALIHEPGMQRQVIGAVVNRLPADSAQWTYKHFREAAARAQEFGWHELAIALSRSAVRLEPGSAGSHQQLINLLQAANDLQGAQAAIDDMRLTCPERADDLQVRQLLLLPRSTDVAARLVALIEDPRELSAGTRVMVNLRLGRDDEAAALFAAMRNYDEYPAEMAEVCAAMGHEVAALGWMRKGLRTRDVGAGNFAQISSSPFLRDARADPRYNHMLSLSAYAPGRMQELARSFFDYLAQTLGTDDPDYGPALAATFAKVQHLAPAPQPIQSGSKVVSDSDTDTDSDD